MPVSRSRYDLLHKRAVRFTRMFEGLEKGRIRALHRTRVASRRLRELLPLLQLPGKEARDVGRRLRKVTRRLGSVRELDVLLLLLDELQESRRYDQDALSAVISRFVQQRSAVRERLMTKLPMRDLERISRKLERAAAKLKSSTSTRTDARGWRWAIDARVRHRADRLKAAIDSAGTLYLTDRLHDVRIGVKKLRYAVEIEAETSADARWRQELTLLKRVQGLLGRLRDRQTLIDHVRQTQASLQPPDVRVWSGLDRLVAALEKECRRLHGRYVRDAQALAALCDRMVGRHTLVARRRAV